MLSAPGTNTNTSSQSPPPPPPPPSRHRVHRAVLPYAYTATPTSHAPPALALFALLPDLEVLPSFSLPRFEFPTAAPALPALCRLEWAFDKAGAAARAGINFLTDMLIAAPNLSELVLTGALRGLALTTLVSPRTPHTPFPGRSGQMLIPHTPDVILADAYGREHHCGRHSACSVA